MKKYFLGLFLFICFISKAQKTNYDVVIIGGGAGGTAAALQAARLGAQVAIIEQTNWLGGMLSSAGVSAVDGNNLLAGGIWNEFRDQLYMHYKTRNLMSGWVSNTLFEPKVADSILKALVGKEKNITLFYNATLKSVERNTNTILYATILWNNKKTIFTSKIFIDATETGELINAAKDNFNIGMDNPTITGENIAKGPNNVLQDLTWVAILKNYNKPALIPMPKNYNAKNYYCSTKDAPCFEKTHPADKIKMLDYGKLPNGSYMLNWPANGNDYYIDYFGLNQKKRKKAFEKAKQKTLGFIYFIQNELKLPNIGIDSNAFDTKDFLAKIPYFRESRRLQGQQILTINELLKPYNFNLYKYGIAVGDYPIDHHHQQNTEAPKIEFPKVPAYNIPIGSLQSAKYNNLLVCDKNISVTNIVNGTTRLQPVCLGTGQAAGALAYAMLASNGKSSKNRLTRTVQEILLNANAYIFPTHDVTIQNPNFKTIQKILATGYIQAIPKAEGWANRMYFYGDSTMSYNELENSLRKNIKRLPTYRGILVSHITIKHFCILLNNAGEAIFKDLWKYRNETTIIEDAAKNFAINIVDEKQKLTRLQIAILLNAYLRPFDFEINETE
jgi:hypothetical protein